MSPGNSLKYVLLFLGDSLDCYLEVCDLLVACSRFSSPSIAAQALQMASNNLSKVYATSVLTTLTLTIPNVKGGGPQMLMGRVLRALGT